MKASLEFKNRVIAELIRRKATLLAELKNAQHKQLEDAQSDDIDFSDIAESPKEQIMDEVGQKTDPINFLTKELERLKAIRTDATHSAVTLGSLVQTNVSYFLIGIAQGQFILKIKS